MKRSSEWKHLQSFCEIIKFIQGDPYERNEESDCCGAKLVPGKGKKKGTLICEICGEEYKEVED